MRTALAIMASYRGFGKRECPSEGGSGRKAVKHRRPCRSAPGASRKETDGRAVACVESKGDGQREKWGAEVGPKMRGLRPRPCFCPPQQSGSFEGLILSEVADRQTQRIDGNQLVWHASLKDENEVRGVEVAFQFTMIGRRVVNEVEVDARAVRRILQLFQRDFLYVDIDLRSRGVSEEFADDVVFAIGVENAVGELTFQKVERLRKVILYRVAVLAVVELRK